MVHKRIISRLLATAVLVLALSGWPTSAVYAGSAALYLSPGSARMSQGHTIWLAIHVNSGGDAINGVQANLSYNPAAFDFVAISTSSSAFSIGAQASGGGGSIQIARGSLSDLTGDNIVASVGLRAKLDAGSSEVDFAGGSQVVRSSDNAGILGGTAPATLSFATSSSPSVSSSPARGGGNSGDVYTPPPVDTTPPVLSRIHTANLAPKAATIVWDTDEPATTQVEYGLNVAYGLSASTPGLSTHHEVALNANFLLPRVVYHFRVRGADASGNQAVSQDISFSSPGYQATVAIIDQNGHPLNNVSVSLGDLVLITDKAGMTVFKNITPGSRLVSATYHGQTKQSRIVVSDSDTAQPMTLKLQFYVAPVPLWQHAWWLLLVLIPILAILWQRRDTVVKILKRHAKSTHAKLGLHPHRHTGKRLSHGHTSYPGIAIVILAGGLALTSFGLPTRASADYSITTTVQGPVPSQSARITSPINGAIVTVARLEVKGTCNRDSVVELLLGGAAKAAGLCAPDGSFNETMDLRVGSNLITAQSINLAGQAGPRSPGIFVTYAPTNGAAIIANPLSLSTEQILKGAWTGEAVQWAVRLDGGTSPYALNFDWGDGSQSDLVSQSASGTIGVSHIYNSAGNYTARVNVTDASGAVDSLGLLMLVHARQAIAGSGSDNSRLFIAWPLYGLVVIMAFCFWLGERFERRRLALA